MRMSHLIIRFPLWRRVVDFPLWRRAVNHPLSRPGRNDPRQLETRRLKSERNSTSERCRPPVTTIIFTSPLAASRLRIEPPIRGLSCPEIMRCKLPAIRRVLPFGPQPIKVPLVKISRGSECADSLRAFRPATSRSTAAIRSPFARSPRAMLCPKPRAAPVIEATRSDFSWVTKCVGACRNTERLLGSLRRLLAAYT